MPEYSKALKDHLAQFDGVINTGYVQKSLHVIRDNWGIPHIRAGSTYDAFFGQGFCMAQDRLFQIELYRRMALGTSAGMLNRGLLRRDKQNRKLGFARFAQLEWEHQTDDEQLILQAYSDGINAVIESGLFPFEFKVISDDGEPYEMAPWHPSDSLAIIKMVSSNNQWASKLKHALVLQELGIDGLLPMIPKINLESSLITPSGARWARTEHPFLTDIESAMGQPDGPINSGGGSNCWVVAPSKSETGHPLVVGDPHLALTTPSQWYVVHMECPEFVAAGPCNPGYPGPVFYGHNMSVAWSMTHAQGDRWDLYKEHIRQSSSGPEAKYLEKWEPLTRREERFNVAGDDEAETEIVWETRHGPVISGDPTHDSEVVATRWGLAETAHDTQAMYDMLRANTVSEAREALRLYDSVSGNYCFADTGGDIGYQYTGRIPKRDAWLLPVPGWTDEYEWKGNIPKDELPTDENPSNGFIVTANNKTTTEDYPYYLSYTATRFRADRLRELLDDQELFSKDDMKLFQGDVTSVHAREIKELISKLTLHDPNARTLQDLLTNWDGTLSADSSGAVIYDALCTELGELTVNTYYSSAKAVSANTAAEVRRILLDELRDNSTLMLGKFDNWSDAVDAALITCWSALTKELGADPNSWRWENIHKVIWRHNLGRDPEWEEIFNAGVVSVPGDGNTPFNTMIAPGTFGTHGVTYRQIFDLGDLNAAEICIPPGNSGQPGSTHYRDNLDRWVGIEYHPLYVDWDDINAHSEYRLDLS